VVIWIDTNQGLAPPDPQTGEIQMIALVSISVSDRALVQDLAGLILSSDFFARSPEGEMFRYEGVRMRPVERFLSGGG
jgi:hypothetical protein